MLFPCRRVGWLLVMAALVVAGRATAQPAAGSAFSRLTLTPSAAQSPQTGSSSSKGFNPDISANGNFLVVAGRNPHNDAPSLALTEVEFAFQAVVDAYARADFYLAASPEGAEIEEGFITFTSLPGRLLLKAGKLRAQFGKLNPLHTHSLPYADRPLVSQNLLGGDEGLADSGLSLSHLLQVPGIFLEATGEVFRGASNVFESHTRSTLVYGGRLRAYRDLTEAANLDAGLSYTRGPAGGTEESDQVLHKQLVGIDITFRYRPLRRAIYRRLNLRTELIWSRQDLGAADSARAFGVYGLGEYQFARRWYAGVRLDRSGRVLDGDLIDTGASAFLTFWPSEFSQVRGQYRRLAYADGVRGNEVLFQVNFSIGAHGAHVF